MIYSTEIYIGNPPQKLRALLDTGSSKFWVASKNVQGNFKQPHSYYDPSKSKTAIHTKEFATSLYGSGGCAGELIKDDIWLGKEEDVMNKTAGKVIHITNFTFGAMNTQKDILDNFRVDAIVGMAYTNLIYELSQHQNNTHKQISFVDALVDQKVLQKNIIGISYVYLDEERHGLKSQISIGSIDESLYEGNISWFPIFMQKYYTIRVDDLLFNNKSLGYCGKTALTGCFMTPDTGMSYISFPEDLFAKMSKNGMKYDEPIKCDPIKRLGTFTLIMGG